MHKNPSLPFPQFFPSSYAQPSNIEKYHAMSCQAPCNAMTTRTKHIVSYQYFQACWISRPQVCSVVQSRDFSIASQWRKIWPRIEAFLLSWPARKTKWCQYNAMLCKSYHHLFSFLPIPPFVHEICRPLPSRKWKPQILGWNVCLALLARMQQWYRMRNHPSDGIDRWVDRWMILKKNAGTMQMIWYRKIARLSQSLVSSDIKIRFVLGRVSKAE